MKKPNKKTKTKKNPKQKKTKQTRPVALARENFTARYFFSKHSSQPTILAPFLLSLRPASCMAKQRSTYSNKKIFRLKYRHNFVFDRSAPVLRILRGTKHAERLNEKFVGVQKNENQTSTKSQQNVTM